MADLQQLYEAVLNGDAKSAVAVTKEALAGNVDPMTLVTKFMVPAMDEVGRRFECEEYFVPELLLAARAMKGSLELIRPLLTASGAEPTGRVVIGTVKGDLHDIGKNLVGSLLEGGGFEVTDLGADVSPERFVEAIRAHNADFICLSALLTVTMPAMKNVIETLKSSGVRDQVKVLVGGAPVTREYAAQIGADGYAENASAAVHLARSLLQPAA
ncbi:MAG: corrinoid protein [Bryobacterales bacterium]|nr:corrinoid protein [Bryobacterales bacterium]